eukprot:9917576-Alexandrium_andersonii.AAC.1
MDPVSLLASVHRSALRMLGDKMGARYVGVAAAARLAPRRNVITMNTQKKLTNLDIECAFLRHATAQFNEAFLSQLAEMLKEDEYEK